jgi:hypothetical protein
MTGRGADRPHPAAYSRARWCVRALIALSVIGCRQTSLTQESADEWYARQAREDIVRYFPDADPSQEIYSGVHNASAVLSLRGEKPLAEHAASKGQAYRFTWSGSFAPHTLVVRVIEWSGSWNLHATWGPRQIVDRQLSMTEADRLSDLLGEVSMGEMPHHIERVGCDGGWWTLESLKDGNFRSASRWSPDGSPFRRLCEYLARLPGFALDGPY